MNHVTEAMDALTGSGALALARDARERVALRANMATNGGEPSLAWLDQFVADLAAAGGSTEDEVQRMVDERAWITDALKYVQYGNPDRVLMVDGLGAGRVSGELAGADAGPPGGRTTGSPARRAAGPTASPAAVHPDLSALRRRVAAANTV